MEKESKEPKIGCGTLILIFIGALILSKLLPEEQGKALLTIVFGAIGLYILITYAYLIISFIWQSIKGDSISEVGKNTVKFIVGSVVVLAILLVLGFLTKGCSSDSQNYSDDEAVPSNARKY